MMFNASHGAIARLTAFIFLLAASLPAAAGPHVVVDVRSGAVLSHEDAFQRWYPASITKLMTAYLAFKAVREGRLSMQSPVRVTKAALAEPPSKMGYPVGSVMTLDNAMKMLLVKSANDIAVAIAEAVAGSELEFISEMNEEARRLGMTGTRFANPNGLPDPANYTTARDMALLAVAIRRQFPEYDPVFAIEAIAAGKHVIRNYNILIGRFAGADGMKTGFICSSGFNLVGSATRDGRTIVAVVLGAKSQEDRAETAAALLARGFDSDPAGYPALATLAPYGKNRDRVVDMRPQICAKEASAERYDGRDVDGHMVFRSPWLNPMNRAPAAIRVGLGGATGPAAANTILTDVPLPRPRPERAGETVAVTIEPARGSEIEGELRAGTGEGIPLPKPRPALTQ